MFRYYWVSYSELLYLSVGFFQLTNAFFGSILQIIAYFLLYIMCISSKSQTVFWAQNFRDVPGESKKYTRLMSHNSASIASILKIPLVLDR